MAALPDNSPWTYLADAAMPLLAIGWLERSRDYAIGPTPRAVFERLREFVRDPWQPFVVAGFHACELCQFEGEKCGAANLFVPYKDRIYVAPELITHYMNAHHYQPPSEFCDAVLACPDMRSMEYKRLLIACGGSGLWRKPSA